MRVVFFREETLGGQTKQKLKPLKAIHIPALSFKKRSVRIPKKDFDVGLVTSANSFRFLTQWPPIKHWVFIGSATKNMSGLSHSVSIEVLQNSHREGVLAYFRRQDTRKKYRSIFFPRSQWGDPRLVSQLRNLGYQVTVRHIYQPVILNFRSQLARTLKKHKVEAFCVTSPSIVKALRKSFSKKQLHSFDVRWVCIGPTTAKEVRKLGITPELAKKSSLEGMRDQIDKPSG